jgi:hypothetical protein
MFCSISYFTYCIVLYRIVHISYSLHVPYMEVQILQTYNVSELSKKNLGIRVINNSGYRAHTAPLFKLNCILPLDQMKKCSNLLFMHGHAT